MRSIPKLTGPQKAAFVACARRLLTEGKNGKPVRFEHCGRSTKGLDCVGAPVWVYAQLGMAEHVRDLDTYARAPDGHTLRQKLREHLGEPIKRHQWQPGDIPLLRWHGKDGEWVNHVGILTRYQFDETGKSFGLLHSLLHNRKVIEHVLDPVWDRRILEVYPT